MEKVVEFIANINKTNSNNEKQQIMKEYASNEFIKKTLVYTYSPLLQFNISSKNVKKFQKNKNYDTQTFNEYTDIFNLLDDLNGRVITGNTALKSVCEFVKVGSKEEQEAIFCIIDKNLKIRTNASTINKVFDNIIKLFEPVLAKEFDPHFNKLNENWFISQKLDGTRCLISIHNNIVKAFSRTGKEIHNIDKIIESIPLNKIKYNVFLDGEIVYIENGQEDFKKTIEIVRSSKSERDTEHLYYKIFDMIPEEEFKNTCGNSMFLDRYNDLCEIFKNNQKIKIVEQIKYTNENFDIMNKKVKDYNWEGIMLRNNKSYKGKRIRDLVKVKTFHDAEYTVKNISSGPVRIIDNTTGLEETIQCMSSVVIECDGIECNVGSGFSHEERIFYHKFPEKIINKQITVKYFEKLESGSLRFPIFKCIRNDI